VTALAAVVLAVAGASSAWAGPTKPGLSSRPAAAAKSGQIMKVMLEGNAIDLSRDHLSAGSTTLVVRSARGASAAFMIARDTGGLDSLPRYSGKPFVPSQQIVGSIETVSAGKQKQVSRRLKPGSYLLVTGAARLGGDLSMIADAVVAFSVR
jgi:hypothetical protein